MFTLSEKIRVLNTPAHVRVYSPANVERVTAATVANGDTLFVEGFGRFEIDKISNIKCRRAVAAVADVKDFAVVVPAGLAVGDAIEVIISLTTSRYQSEVLTQNQLGGGRTFKFATAPLTAVTAAAIETAIVAGFQLWLQNFAMGAPLVTVTASPVVGDIVRVTGDAVGSITIDRLEIRRVQQGIATQVPVSLAMTTIASAFEGHGLGKFLEESIRMSVPENTDPYASDAADTRVDLRGAYTEISFDYATSYSENLSTTAADWATSSIGGPAQGGTPATHSFTLFLNEGTSLAADSAIEKLAAIAVLRSTALPYLTNTVIAAPLTVAQEESEVLIYKDNSSKATTATFIA